MNVRFFDVAKQQSYPISGPLLLEPRVGATVDINGVEFQISDARYVLEKGDWELLIKIEKRRPPLFALFSQDTQLRLTGALAATTYVIIGLIGVVLWKSPDKVLAFIAWHVRDVMTFVLAIALPVIGITLIRPEARPSDRSFMTTYAGALILTTAFFIPFVWRSVAAPEAPLVTDADAIAYLTNLFSQSKGIVLGLLGWASLCATILKLVGLMAAYEKIKTLGELSPHDNK